MRKAQILARVAPLAAAILLASAMLAAGQVARPSIADLSPGLAPVGSSIIISGSNFDPVASNNIVHFGTVRGNVISATATQLVVTVPAGAAYAPVSVTVGGLTAASRLPFGVAF